MSAKLIIKIKIYLITLIFFNFIFLYRVQIFESQKYGQDRLVLPLIHSFYNSFINTNPKA